SLSSFVLSRHTPQSLSTDLPLCSFTCHADRRELHPFPTRRSSDLGAPGKRGAASGRGVAARERRGDPGGARRRRCLAARPAQPRSEEHTSELQSRENLVCRLLLEKKNKESTAATRGRRAAEVLRQV